MHETQASESLTPAGRSLEERVIAVVADTLGLEPSGIQAGQSLMTQLGANSIDLVDLGFRLEQTFGIDIDTNRLIEQSPGPAGRNELTVGRLVELVRLAQGGSAADTTARSLSCP